MREASGGDRAGLPRVKQKLKKPQHRCDFGDIACGLGGQHACHTEYNRECMAEAHAIELGN